MKNKITFTLLLFFSIIVSIVAKNTFTVFNLTCEHEENPIGIENVRPRFSWQINSQERHFEQSAWQLLVADSEEEVTSGNGRIWDSGKVNSASSVLVSFAEIGRAHV